MIRKAGQNPFPAGRITANRHSHIAVPVTMIGFVVKMIPDKVFEDLRGHTP